MLKIKDLKGKKETGIYHTPQNIIDAIGRKVIEPDIGSGSFLLGLSKNILEYKAIIGNPPFEGKCQD